MGFDDADWGVGVEDKIKLAPTEEKGEIVIDINSPETITSQLRKGLNNTPTRLGFYDGNVWKSYITSDGKFKFEGDGTNYIEWTGNSLVVRGNLTADDISTGYLQSTNWGTTQGTRFDLSNGNLYIGGSTDPNLSWSGTTLKVKGDISSSSFIGGYLQSTNWGATQGTRFDLDNEEILLGGSTDPNLSWSGTTLKVKGDIIIENTDDVITNLNSGNTALTNVDIQDLTLDNSQNPLFLTEDGFYTSSHFLNTVNFNLSTFFPLGVLSNTGLYTKNQVGGNTIYRISSDFTLLKFIPIHPTGRVNKVPFAILEYDVPVTYISGWQVNIDIKVGGTSTNNTIFKTSAGQEQYTYNADRRVYLYLPDEISTYTTGLTGVITLEVDLTGIPTASSLGASTRTIYATPFQIYHKNT